MSTRFHRETSPLPPRPHVKSLPFHRLNVTLLCLATIWKHGFHTTTWKYSAFQLYPPPGFHTRTITLSGSTATFQTVLSAVHERLPFYNLICQLRFSHKNVTAVYFTLYVHEVSSDKCYLSCQSISSGGFHIRTVTICRPLS